MAVDVALRALFWRLSRRRVAARRGCLYQKISDTRSSSARSISARHSTTRARFFARLPATAPRTSPLRPPPPRTRRPTPSRSIAPSRHARPAPSLSATPPSASRIPSHSRSNLNLCVISRPRPATRPAQVHHVSHERERRRRANARRSVAANAAATAAGADDAAVAASFVAGNPPTLRKPRRAVAVRRVRLSISVRVRVSLRRRVRFRLSFRVRFRLGGASASSSNAPPGESNAAYAGRRIAARVASSPAAAPRHPRGDDRAKERRLRAHECRFHLPASPVPRRRVSAPNAPRIARRPPPPSSDAIAAARVDPPAAMALPPTAVPSRRLSRMSSRRRRRRRPGRRGGDGGPRRRDARIRAAPGEHAVPAPGGSARRRDTPRARRIIDGIGRAQRRHLRRVRHRRRATRQARETATEVEAGGDAPRGRAAVSAGFARAPPAAENARGITATRTSRAAARKSTAVPVGPLNAPRCSARLASRWSPPPPPRASRRRALASVGTPRAPSPRATARRRFHRRARATRLGIAPLVR